MKKALALCLLLLCLPLGAGCSLQGIADAYGFALDTLSAMGLEVTQQVLGTREQGADGITGRYTAEYTDFHGKEVIFGNASLGDKAGRKITIRCQMEIAQGEARLMMKSGTEPARVLCESSSLYRETISLPDAANYIWVEGDGWTGSIDLDVT